MDYSYYQNPPQAYPFLGLPTPAHSASAVSSEDFNHSPTVRAPSFHYVSSPAHMMQQQQQQQQQQHLLLLHHHHHQLHHPQTQALPRSQAEDYHGPASASSASSSPPLAHALLPLSLPLYSQYPSLHSSPVSPVQHSSPFLLPHSPHLQTTPPLLPLSQASYLTPRGQDGYDQFQNYDYGTHYTNANPAALPKAATPIQPQPRASLSNGSGPINAYDVTKFEPNNSLSNLDVSNLDVSGVDPTQDDARRSAGQNQSNSDDDDMTPAQSRRKAQNRAAQRAFRERKERHVKDLEAKLAALESQSKSLSSENERLKVQLQKASTENEILKATSSSSHRSVTPPTTAGPLRYSPTDFYSEVLQSHENKTPSHRIVLSEGGERLLAAGAAWDYIISHPLFLRGLVDVGDVSERLKTLARCDGQGPVFEESAIIKAIEMSVASGSDELM